MPEGMEYRVIGDSQWEQLENKLNRLAAEGFRPILMSSVTTPTGVKITVILEHAVIARAS
jgi:hypothetical protein